MRPGIGRLAANLSTLANALVGVGAVAYVLAGNPLWAMLLIVSGIGFDGLDGWFHRRSGAPPSSFGRVADSVADAVTFGIAPAALLAVHTRDASLWAPYSIAALLVGGIVAGLAIARLVRFTASTTQTHHFEGVPTPQNAIGLILILLLFDVPAYLAVRPLPVLVGAVVLAATMVLPIRFPKIRRGSVLRSAMTVTGVALVAALLPIQFRPSPGSPLFDLSLVGTAIALVGAITYYVGGPWTVRKEMPTASGSP